MGGSDYILEQERHFDHSTCRNSLFLVADMEYTFILLVWSIGSLGRLIIGSLGRLIIGSLGRLIIGSLGRHDIGICFLEYWINDMWNYSSLTVKYVRLTREPLTTISLLTRIDKRYNWTGAMSPHMNSHIFNRS